LYFQRNANEATRKVPSYGIQVIIALQAEQKRRETAYPGALPWLIYTHGADTGSQVWNHAVNSQH